MRKRSPTRTREGRRGKRPATADALSKKRGTDGAPPDGTVRTDEAVLATTSSSAKTRQTTKGATAHDEPSSAAALAATECEEHARGRRFSIVGIGASAGGLEALEDFLKHSPPDTG